MTIEPGVGAQCLQVPKLAACQAMRAVVQNALQASPPTRRVTIVGSELDGDLLVAVSDAGPGMTAEVLRGPAIRFSRPRIPAREWVWDCFLPGGSWNAWGRRLSIDSKPDVGTTVTIRLPLEKPAAVTGLARQR